MAKETPPSLTPIVVDPEAAKDKDRWIGAVDAAATLGVAFTTWRKKEAEGLFQRYTLHSKVVYDKQEIEAFAALEEPGDGGMGAVVNVLLQHAKEQNKHTIELVKATGESNKQNADVVKANADTLRSENDALRARCADLETKYLGAVNEFEKAAQSNHERELARKMLERQEGRKDKGWEMVMALAPVLSEQVLGVHVIGKLMKSFTEEQLIALTDDTIGFLKPEQKEHLKHGLAKFREADKRKEKLPTPEKVAKDIVDKVSPGSQKPEGLSRKPRFVADIVDRVTPNPKANGAPAAPAPEKGPDPNGGTERPET